MSNVGYATLQIVPSMRGIEAAMRSELSGNVGASAGQAVGQQVGDAAGEGFGSRFRSSVGGAISGISRAIGDTITTGLTAAGLAAGTVLGASLFKGFERFTTIQDATAALTISLGSAAKAGELLGKVLDVVKGTPFNLDQFAAAAQSLAGFGISAEKIPGILTAIGEASATQGKRAGEFASRLTEVFGQMAAKGKVGLEDVWRISETGVNALTILANHFGLTTDEMRKMISSGTVPAGEAIDALVKGIREGSHGIAGDTVSLAGTMAKLRDTLSGSLGGLGASLARFGETIITPLAGPLTALFQSLTTGFDTLAAKVRPVVESFAASATFAQFTGFLAGLPALIGPAVDGLGRFKDILVPLGAAMTALALGGIAGLLGPLGAIVPTISPVIAAFAGLVAVSPELRQAFSDLWEVVQPLAATLGKELLSVLTDLAKTVVPVLAAAITALAPAFAPVLASLGVIAGSVGSVITALAPLLPVVAGLAAAVAPLVAKLVELAAVFLSALAPAVTPVLTALTEVVAKVADALLPVLDELKPVLVDMAESLGEVLLALVPLIPPLGDLLVAITPLIPDIVKLTAEFFKMAPVLIPLIEAFTKLVTIFVESLVPVLDKLVPLIEKVLALFTKWVEFVSKVQAALAELVSKLGDFATTMHDLGAKAMESLGKGMEGAIGKLTDIAGKIKDKIVSKLNPANWFSTPEEHYRELWGAAFASIADEGRKNLRSIGGIAGDLALAGSAVVPTPQFRRDGVAGAGAMAVDYDRLGHAVTKSLVDSGLTVQVDGQTFGRITSKTMRGREMARS